MKNQYKIETTKSGIPAMWEKGGAYSNTGEAVIFADHNGYPKRPLCVRTRGDLACGNHALIPVTVGDTIVTVNRQHDRVSVTVERIAAISDELAMAEHCTDPICVDAIHAAIAKADDYHCRSAYYIKTPDRD